MAARARARRGPGLEIRKWFPDWRHALRSRHVPSEPRSRVAFRFARVNGALHYTILRELSVLMGGELKRAVSAMSPEDLEQARRQLQDLRHGLGMADEVVGMILTDVETLAARPVQCRQQPFEVLTGGRT